MFMAVSLPPVEVLPPVAEVPPYLDFLPIFCHDWPDARRMSPCSSTTASPRSSSACSARRGASTARTRGSPTSTSPSARPSPGACRRACPGSRSRSSDGLERLDDADLICLPAMPRDAAGARRRHRRPAGGARPRRASAVGVRRAFVLGEAGLLDGRLVHDPLALRRRARGALPARRGRAATSCTSTTAQIITSAGSAAGLDACLHMIRQRVRRRHGGDGRAPDGGRAAPRRRPGAVHRVAGRR